MRSLLRDLRYGVRMLAKSPGVTAVAVITLALGIGATTVIFSVVNAVLIRPLPFPESERLVMLWETNPEMVRLLGRDRMPAAAPTLREWQTQNSVFDGVAGFYHQTFDLVGTDEPEVVLGARVTASLFSVLGVNAAHGRTFLPEEDQPGRDDVVVMSHALWQSRFGADSGILGQTIVLDGASYTVVGIMPPGFRFPGGIGLGKRLRMGPRTDLWKPMAFTPREANSGGRNYHVVARQKRDVSLEQVRAEMSAITEGLQQQDSRWKDWGVMVVPLHEETTGSLRTALLVLLGGGRYLRRYLLLGRRATARDRHPDGPWRRARRRPSPGVEAGAGAAIGWSERGPGWRLRPVAVARKPALWDYGNRSGDVRDRLRLSGYRSAAGHLHPCPPRGKG